MKLRKKKSCFCFILSKNINEHKKNPGDHISILFQNGINISFQPS